MSTMFNPERMKLEEYVDVLKMDVEKMDAEILELTEHNKHLENVLEEAGFVIQKVVIETKHGPMLTDGTIQLARDYFGSNL